MKKYTLYFLLLILMVNCGISEDCFKGNGNPTMLNYSYDNFTKVKVYSGVGLVVKEGLEYDIKIETRDNIKDNIEVTLEGEMLVIKDNSTCNIARDYGATIVYITIPDGSILPLITELELYSKTEQKVQSDGVLHSPIVRLFSLGDDGDEAGTGDFNIQVDNGQLVVESNTVSNYYIEGNCNQMLLNFYFGDGRFYGENLFAQSIIVYHRGSNDMFVYPIDLIEGTIFGTGNIVLKNVPPIVDVEEIFRGRVIY